MRPSLAVTETPSAIAYYPKGSIVLCQQCLKPLFVLERGIGMGERAGRAADAFRPIRPQELETVADGSQWSADQRRQHCEAIPAPRAGTEMFCPCCQHTYVRIVAVTGAEVIDRAYTLELITIPPGADRTDRQERAWRA